MKKVLLVVTLLAVGACGTTFRPQGVGTSPSGPVAPRHDGVGTSPS